jgi:hypothetical protein
MTMGTGIQMTTTARTRALTAAIEGLLASMWFAWARADAPSSARLALEVGGVVALLVAVAGLAVAASRDGPAAPAWDAAVRRRYNRIVASELVLLGAGAAVLAAVGLGSWIAAWLCAGVGLHFLPASRAFATPFLALVGVAITGAAVAAVGVGLETTLAPAVIAGSGAGVCLLVAALGSLAGAFGTVRDGAAAQGHGPRGETV